MTRGAILLVSVALLLSACGSGRHPISKPIELASADGETLTFGGVEPVVGTPFATIPLLVGRGKRSSYSSDRDERNRLILDTRNGASRRVLPDLGRATIDRWIEPAKRGEGNGYEHNGRQVQPEPSEIYAAVIRHEHGEGKDPTFDILLGRYDDGRQRWAARGLKGASEIWKTSEGRIATVVETDNKAVFRLYDTVSLQLVLQTDL